MKKTISTILVTLLMVAFIGIAYADSSVGEFKSSSCDDYTVEKGVYYLDVGGHRLSLTYTEDILYVDGKQIDTDVLWNYLSDGTVVYYSKEDGIYKANITTGEKELIVSDETPFIDGIYKNKYLYYGTYKYTDITESLSDTVIFDLENKKEIGYIVDVGNLVMTDSKIYTTPCVGDVSEVNITEMNFDGSNPKIIATDGSVIEVFNNQLYYSVLDYSDGYENLKGQVRKYDSVTGKSENLTDYFYGFAVEINEDHVIAHKYEGNSFRVDYKKNIKVILNGAELSFDQPPVIKDNRTLVPLRAIFEAMGATVEWDDNTRTVTSVLNNTEVKLSIGSNELYKNGTVETIDVPAQIINNRTMVPVRAISEAFGAEVTWNDKEQIVNINK